MDESEWLHVQRVMERLQVKTVLIASLDNPDERVYVNGELVYTGPDSAESRGYWGVSHSLCVTIEVKKSGNVPPAMAPS